MKSRWFEYKEAAVSLRKTGMSMTQIERRLGIPRSTLSGWLRTVVLTEEQRLSLMKNKQDGWAKARINAVAVHNARKAARLALAESEARNTLQRITVSKEILDLALAMLYLGEGAKTGGTSIASSDPTILRFVLTVLKQNYSVKPDSIRCDLHLRMDQDAEETKAYWAKSLNLTLENFKYVVFDKRSEGRATFDRYKGVCVISCGNIAIQRKLMYLYNLFCEKVSEMDVGA